MTEEKKGKLLTLEGAPTPAGKLLKELEKYAYEEVSFTPTKQMDKAKSRLWTAIKGNPLMATRLEDIDLEEIFRLCGTPKAIEWADTHPFFLRWLCDEHYERHDLEALAEKAKRKLEEIMDSPMEPKLLTAKDQLNAANMLLQLADKFPNKRKEFVYIDKELAKMTDGEVEREREKLARQMQGALPAGQIDMDNEDM